MIFEREAVGGPWKRRLAGQRAFLEHLTWDEPPKESAPDLAEQARVVWTQSAFSEHAGAAAFAEIASALLAAGAFDATFREPHRSEWCVPSRPAESWPAEAVDTLSA